MPAALVAAVALVAGACVMNGSWTPNAPASVPIVHPSLYELTDVSCPTTTWCMAVGNNNDPIVQTWNGSVWTNGTLPPDGDWDGGMEAVSCGAPNRCMGVTDRLPDSPSDYQYLVAWNGTAWVEVPPGVPIDGSDPVVFSCAADGCVVMNDSSGVMIVWDGSTFATSPFDSTDIGGVESAHIVCQATDDCLTASYGATAHWDGSDWTVLAGNTLLDLYVDGIIELDCPTASRCVGIGYHEFPPAQSFISWDGTTWTATAGPAASAGWPLDLSCASSVECVALFSGSGNASVVKAWNGSTWFDAPAPPGGSTAAYAGISCASLRCVAVGAEAAPSPQLLIATYTWSNA